jgi:glutamate-1-semialdehyde 2,1-aminomutase
MTITRAHSPHATSGVESALWEEAQRHFVGGVNSPVRAYRAVGGDPPIVRRAEGPYLITEDGRTYVDFVGSFGPLVLGHADPEVVAAVQQATAEGTSFAATHRGEIELARRVKALIPGIEKLRLVNSGTEAVSGAVRLARGYTGRNRVLKFEGCYHGHVDGLLVRGGSGLATFGIATSAGVTPATAAETVVVGLDDEAALSQAFERHGRELAAAIVEPLPANCGLLPQRPEFLARLRALCSEHGALLIFDEVISGLRLAAGSYANQIDVAPDLFTLGKVIGGGLPVGAFGGRAEIMDLLAPLGPVYQAGTLSGNPLATAGGNATLHAMVRRDGWRRLEELGAHLERALEPVLDRAPLPFTLVRVESIFWLAYGEGAPWRDVARLDPAAPAVFAKLHRALRERGFLLAPSAYEVGFLSLAHEEPVLEAFAAAVEESLREIS